MSGRLFITRSRMYIHMNTYTFLITGTKYLVYNSIHAYNQFPTVVVLITNISENCILFTIFLRILRLSSQMDTACIT